MNTALANLGLFYGFGVFDDVIPQIEAVCDYLRAAGFTKVILAGHGLGAAMVVRYAATRNHPASKPELVQGLVAIAAPYCLPETIRRRWERFDAEPRALAGPEAVGARVYQHIGQVAVPLLLVSTREDEIVAAQEGEDLSGVARSAGNPDVTHVVLDANHRFNGKHKELSDTVAQWLGERVGRQRHAQ